LSSIYIISSLFLWNKNIFSIEKGLEVPAQLLLLGSLIVFLRSPHSPGELSRYDLYLVTTRCEEQNVSALPQLHEALNSLEDATKSAYSKTYAAPI